LCQGVLRGDVARNYPATVHCPTCDGWLCDVHAQGEQWHSSTLQRRVDVGGRGVGAVRIRRFVAQGPLITSSSTAPSLVIDAGHLAVESSSNGTLTNSTVQLPEDIDMRRSNYLCKLR
jgi:hypothetical protein